MGKSEACGVYRAENPFFFFCSCSEESGAKWGAAVGIDRAAGGQTNWMYRTGYSFSNDDKKIENISISLLCICTDT